MRPKIKQKSLCSPSIRFSKWRVILAKIVSSALFPKEWFLVPLFAIDEIIEKIKDGTIAGYVYDPKTEKLSKAKMSGRSIIARIICVRRRRAGRRQVAAGKDDWSLVRARSASFMVEGCDRGSSISTSAVGPRAPLATGPNSYRSSSITALTASSHVSLGCSSR